MVGKRVGLIRMLSGELNCSRVKNGERYESAGRCGEGEKTIGVLGGI